MNDDRKKACLAEINAALAEMNFVSEIVPMPSEFLLYEQSTHRHGIGTWQPLPLMRQIRRATAANGDGIASLEIILQQQWQNNATAETEWRDVPIVDEPDQEATK